MKIVIAPDSFKESLTAVEAATRIEAGFREVFPEADYVKIPFADGGEGTVEAMVAATGGRRVEVQVTGPLGERVDGFYGISGDGQTAVIEMAAASGLSLIAVEKRNPLHTTTYGTGELVRHALDAGLRKFIIGIGGSATNDAGAGMLQALGARLLDRMGQEIGFGGGALSSLVHIDCTGLDRRLHESRTVVACDVDNPLIGPDGASVVYGPQKGADPATVAVLDANLTRFAKVVELDFKNQIAAIPGSGAAGGMGAALVAFLDAGLKPGVQIVMEATGLSDAMIGADLVVTGEGQIDGQTVHGKTPVGVAQLASKHGIPVIALAGGTGPGAEKVHEHGITALFCMGTGPCSLAEALPMGAENLRNISKNVAAVIKAFIRRSNSK